MYALMLEDRADLIKEFQMLEDALNSLERLVAREPQLASVAVVKEYTTTICSSMHCYETVSYDPRTTMAPFCKKCIEKRRM
jgi:hypothetical protein